MDKETERLLDERLQEFRYKDSEDDCKTHDGMNVYGFDYADWELLIRDLNKILGIKLTP